MNVTFKIAKLAQEKGFSVITSCLYNPRDPNGKPLEGNVVYKLLRSEPDLSKHLFCPTQSGLQKWLREVHKIYVTPLPSYADSTDDKLHFFEIAIKNKINSSYIYYKTYEKSLEAGLKYGLNLIKTKPNEKDKTSAVNR